MAKLPVNDFDGAFPSLDRKKVAKPHVVDGKNYLVDLDGPKSAFGWQKPYEKFNPSFFVQHFEVASDVFYFARDVDETELQISKVDWAFKQIYPIHTFVSADLTRPKLNMPWTHALVGGYHYFANRTWGVLQYDPITKNWVDVTTTIGISDIFAICESGGRLCCLADGIVSWSAIDDGMDNTPSTTTGAGFQNLSLIGTLEKNTDYLGIQKISRGFLAFTSKGVMRGELIDSIIPFRNLPGETKHVPLNPWCITKTTETDVMILTRFGLFTSADGFLFEEFQPLQNEYFKMVEIPPLKPLGNGYIALFYSEARDELYVSLATSQILNQYTKAWVLYVKRGSWGTFNQVHRGFVGIDVDGLGIDTEQGYIAFDGKLAYLNDSTPSTAIEAQNTRGIYIAPALTYEPFQIAGVNRMITNSRLTGFSRVPFPSVTAFYEEAGAADTFKTNNPESGVETTILVGSVYIMEDHTFVDSALIVIDETVQNLVSHSLDSFIEVGLFRFSTEEATDELSFISNVAISCLDQSESTGSVMDDWLEDYPSDIFEDWNALSGSEDWGSNTVTGSTYTQKIRGSLDGYETFEDQFVDIDEVKIVGKTKFCSCANAGIFESVVITADQINQSFHLKTLELTGTIIGRL